MTKQTLEIRRLTLAGFVAIVAVLGIAAPAQAHNYYVDSTPSIDATLTTMPEEFVITTNDNLLDLGAGNGGFLLEIVGPDGLFYGDGCVTVAGPSVSTAAAIGPAGAYELNWQAVSADGHTVSGAVPFTWAPAAGDASATAGAKTPPTCGGSSGVTGPTTAPQAASGGSSADNSSMDALWIGGAVLAVAIAGLATFLLLGRKKK